MSNDLIRFRRLVKRKYKLLAQALSEIEMISITLTKFIHAKSFLEN